MAPVERKFVITKSPSIVAGVPATGVQFVVGRPLVVASSVKSPESAGQKRMISSPNRSMFSRPADGIDRNEAAENAQEAHSVG
ncbi:MAG: hypothetical protein HY674_00930 [Chloroflexi bacterium]|nr:hypothetical protein [Chloroflexota bacterium]